MSQENVGVVQEVVEAAQRGDWAAAISRYDETVELDTSRMPDGGVYHGHEGLQEFFARWFGAWDDFRISPERFIEADDRVVVISQLRARGRSTGIEVTMRLGDVYTVQDGKVVRMAGYPVASEALEAVGLSEHEARS